MVSDWHIVTFPLILPWREDFWTLPLFFPQLRVGVTPGWPAQLPYHGMPLPPEAQVLPQELKQFRPGELRQMQAFAEFQEAQAEAGDLLGKIRNYGQAEAPPPDASPQAWALAWQLEKLQADQEAQMQMVEQGHEWLRDILSPEPWSEQTSFGPAPGGQEMMDPDLAQLRYRLWRRVMEPQMEEPWVPFLLGRASRSLFLTLKGWPEQTVLQKVEVSLPGCRSAEEFARICGNGEAPPWQAQAVDRVAALLEAADDLEELQGAARELNEFLAKTVMPDWPFPVAWNFDLEVWCPAADEEGPVLCWTGADAKGLPG